MTCTKTDFRVYQPLIGQPEEICWTCGVAKDKHDGSGLSKLVGDHQSDLFWGVSRALIAGINGSGGSATAANQQTFQQVRQKALQLASQTHGFCTLVLVDTRLTLGLMEGSSYHEHL